VRARVILEVRKVHSEVNVRLRPTDKELLKVMRGRLRNDPKRILQEAAQEIQLGNDFLHGERVCEEQEVAASSPD
jgi:hypothetical protein